MTAIPTNKLSIYLIKEEYSQHGDILKDFAVLHSHEIQGVATLYFGQSHTHKPSWLQTFFGTTIPDDLSLFNASSKAILLTEVSVEGGKKRLFAVPFGYGWMMLNDGVYEERFGLKVTLNTVDPSSLRSISKRNMASVPKYTTEQMSKDGVAGDFGIDVEQDLVQSITGRSKDLLFGKTITGKDSVSASPKVDISNLPQFLRVCYQQYTSTAYKKDFGWIDQMADVKNPILINELDEQLVKNINARSLDKTWMAVPEIINWSDVAGFAYSGRKTATRYDDLHILNFIDSLPKDQQKNIDINTLRSRHVYCFGAAGDDIKYQWTVYNCLYSEISDGKSKKTYLLSNGKWYAVEENFAKRVNADYKSLMSSAPSVSLPEYNHINENDYNDAVAKADAQLCCMDQKNIFHGGGHSQIEFCDLFSKDGKIIHVKRYAGSAVLSHLFFQGVVSGEVFLADSEFRKKLNIELKAGHKLKNPNTRPDAGDYEIVFAVVSSSIKALDLPFFAKVGLRNAKRRLETFGYKKVSLIKISTKKKATAT